MLVVLANEGTMRNNLLWRAIICALGSYHLFSEAGRKVRIIACMFDDVEELSGIKAPTMNAFFHKFSEMGRKELFPQHVSMPSTLEQLVKVEAAYAAVGIPGACGSMDVVHIPLGA